MVIIFSHHQCWREQLLFLSEPFDDYWLIERRTLLLCDYKNMNHLLQMLVILVMWRAWWCEEQLKLRWNDGPFFTADDIISASGMGIMDSFIINNINIVGWWLVMLVKLRACAELAVGLVYLLRTCITLFTSPTNFLKECLLCDTQQRCRPRMVALLFQNVNQLKLPLHQHN